MQRLTRRGCRNCRSVRANTTLASDYGIRRAGRGRLQAALPTSCTQYLHAHARKGERRASRWDARSVQFDQHDVGPDGLELCARQPRAEHRIRAQRGRRARRAWAHGRRSAGGRRRSRKNRSVTHSMSISSQARSTGSQYTMHLDHHGEATANDAIPVPAAKARLHTRDACATGATNRVSKSNPKPAVHTTPCAPSYCAQTRGTRSAVQPQVDVQKQG